jgi:hypothetical protein
MQEGTFAPMTNETSAKPCTQEKQEETHPDSSGVDVQ